jgi:alpha-beta hydrolase superfamily lysophospholipase
LAAELEQREGTLASPDGTRLYWQSWPVPEPRAIVEVVHGLGEHSGRYAGLAAALNRQGVACFAVDLRGMGRSEGQRGHVDRWQQWVDDCAAFHELVLERAGGTEVVPLGHSFGGVLLLSAVLDGALKPRRFAMSNPAFRPAIEVPAWKLQVGRLTSRLLPRLALGNEVDASQLSREPGYAAAYMTDPLVHDRISSRLYTEWLAASDSALRRPGELTVPFLLILSEEDRLIDHTAALEFAGGVRGDHTVKVYPERFHEPFHDLGAEEVFADLIAWLD